MREPSTSRRSFTVNGPITSRFTASSIRITMIGTATTPLTIALYTSALIGSTWPKSSATPMSVAAESTA